MFTAQDFANIYCCSKRTIERRIQRYAVVFRSFSGKKRKHFYDIDESRQLIKLLGVPPDTENNRQLMRCYPTLIDLLKK